jgi:hypothetical protein
MQERAVNDDDRLIAKRIKLWVDRRLQPDSTDLDEYGSRHTYPYSIFVTQLVSIADCSIRQFEIRIGGGVISLSEDRERPPVRTFDLADPEAEAAFAACMAERYEIVLPSSWLLPRRDRKPVTRPTATF